MFAHQWSKTVTGSAARFSNSIGYECFGEVSGNLCTNVNRSIRAFILAQTLEYAFWIVQKPISIPLETGNPYKPSLDFNIPAANTNHKYLHSYCPAARRRAGTLTHFSLLLTSILFTVGLDSI